MAGVQRYIKKPVEVEAIQFDGKNTAEVSDFIGRPVTTAYGNKIIVATLHGHTTAAASDFIVKTGCGDFYPCAEHVFRETHEPAPPKP